MTVGRGRAILTSQLKLKLQLSAVLTIFFCVPYFALQQFPMVSPRRLPLSTIDQVIAFEPAWVWIYQSVYLLLALVPWAATSADHLRRYARGFLCLAAAGFAFFLLMPVEGPRPAALPPDMMFRALVWYDAPLNSFPSLHVGLSVYTVLFAARAVCAPLAARTRQHVVLLLAVWTAAIAFAALATKQHYAIDLPAGALLAWAVHSAAWRGSRHEANTSGLHDERSADAEGIWSRVGSSALPAASNWCGTTAADASIDPGGGGPRVLAQAEADLRTGHP